MLILGHELINSDVFYKINNFDEVKKTASNSIVIIKFDGKLILELIKNKVKFAVLVDNLKEAIFSESLKAKYIIANNLNLAIEIQKLADNYLYDSKNIFIINSDDELETVAKNKIDGVLYIYSIKNIN